MQTVIGWDIGGAHLKAARIEAGRVTAAGAFACPLWQGVERLDEAFAAAREMVGAAPWHAVTMTGEVCDAFASRAAGVSALAARAVAECAEGEVRFYAGAAGFVPPEAAAGHARAIASANWRASAELAARSYPEALFIDMGSTTTDIVPIRAGHVAARGHDDAARAEHGELLYTGLVRTFVMALAEKAPFEGRWTRLMNEYFAASADVHRILGSLPDGADMMPTADGRGKSIAASMARLARMIGRDSADSEPREWRKLAAWFAERQVQAMTEAALQVISRSDLDEDEAAPIVAAGVGRGVVQELARRLKRRCIGFGTLVPVDDGVRGAAGDCAPAAAVGLLLHGA